MFPKLEESMSSISMSTSQVEMSLRKDGQVFVMFASLRVERNVVAGDMPVVFEFPDVFLEDFVTSRRSEKLNFP